MLFLDDLQWADTATLTLLESLLTSREIRHFLLSAPIGRMRWMLVMFSPDHQRSGSGARQNSPHYARPSASSHVIDLLRDTLQSDEAKVTPLAQFLVERTDGNPFFMLQFMQTLHAEGLGSIRAKQWASNRHDRARRASGGVVDS